MGEAARRKKALETWWASLTEEENVVADTCLSLYNNFIVPEHYTGGCYHMAFLLTEYLREKKAINVTPVVGFVNDGTDKIMISHAWIELNSKKSDVTLAVTDNQNTGSLLILDYPMKRGRCVYSYHLEDTLDSRNVLQQIAANDPDYAVIVAEKDTEHRRMLKVATSRELIHEYLASAPKALSYDRITSRID